MSGGREISPVTTTLISSSTALEWLVGWSPDSLGGSQMSHAKQNRGSVLINRPRIPQLDHRRDYIDCTRGVEINLGLIMQSHEGNQLHSKGERN